MAGRPPVPEPRVKAGIWVSMALRMGNGAGRYGAVFTPKALGNWELRQKAERGDVAWQQVQRLVVR